MSSHYKLKATIEGVEVVGESLELTGSKSFKVFPVEKNETQAPIRGSAVVSILGKNHSISLTHKIKTHEDPEPSSTKWSYIENMYVTGNTPVATADVKNQDIAYVRASRGTTMYISNSSIITKLFVSKSYINYQNLLDTVDDFSGTTYSTQYIKGDIMTLFIFTMYYKYSTESGGTIVPPVDDGTPASNKARIPCRPDYSSAPDWITNLSLIYQVNYTKDDNSSDSRIFSTWDDFIAFWDSIQTNPSYTDAVFHYILQGTVAFNELLDPRGGSSPITITEIDNGKGIGIHGAKNLYLVISQQEGKTVYGASIIPADTSMQDTNGRWNFEDPTVYEIATNKASVYSQGTYNLKPKFRIDLANQAYPINVMTSTIIRSQIESGGSAVNYQYIGQPFILKLFKETANGIEGRSMRPYYKLTSSSTAGSTEFWRDSINILGSQNFNPIQYDEFIPELHLTHLRNCGYRGFLAGPMSGNYGLCIFQLVPLCLYKQNQEQYTFTDGRLTNYNTRYLNYQCAIFENDRYSAAFLKWPNPDGNNDPSHIDTQGDTESIPSQMGKMWESNVQHQGDFKFINRVMFIPVLWTGTRLEDSEGLRNILINETLGFGYYLLSPDITDSEIDLNPTTIYRIHIDGLDIQIR